MLRVRFSETIDKRNRKCGRNDGTDIGTIASQYKGLGKVPNELQGDKVGRKPGMSLIAQPLDSNEKKHA